MQYQVFGYIWILKKKHMKYHSINKKKMQTTNLKK